MNEADEILRGLRDPELDLTGLLGGLLMDIRQIITEDYPVQSPRARLAAIGEMIDRRDVAGVIAMTAPPACRRAARRDRRARDSGRQWQVTGGVSTWPRAARRTGMTRGLTGALQKPPYLLLRFTCHG
jgi:hypothetical protein